MERNTKIVIGIGITIIVIAGGSLLYFYVIKPKLDAKKALKQAKQDLLDAGVPEKQAEQKVQQLEKDINEQLSNNPPSPPTPTMAIGTMGFEEKPSISTVIKETTKKDKDKKNFDAVKKNLGDKAAWKSDYSTGVVISNGLFVAVFQPIGTFYIYKNGDATKKTLLWGQYSEGGLMVKEIGTSRVFRAGGKVENAVIWALNDLVKSKALK